MHVGLVSLYLKFPVCKLETKSLQHPVADQGIKPTSQPSTAARGVPRPHVQTPSQEGQPLPPAHSQVRALSTECFCCSEAGGTRASQHISPQILLRQYCY